MSGTFTVSEVLQLDSSRYWSETSAYKDDGYEKVEELHFPVGHGVIVLAEDLSAGDCEDNLPNSSQIELGRSIRVLCGLLRTRMDWHCQSRMD